MPEIYNLALQKANGNARELRQIIKEYSQNIKESEQQIINGMKEPLKSILKELMVNEDNPLPYGIYSNKDLALAICQYPYRIKNLVDNGIINLETKDPNEKTIFDWVELEKKV